MGPAREILVLTAGASSEALTSRQIQVVSPKLLMIADTKYG